MNDRWTPADLANYQTKRGLRLEIVSAQPKPNKYHNKKTEVDGIVFDSKREATRYEDLKVMQQSGLISDLTLQPKYPLIVNQISVGSYIGDFRYVENGNEIVEDAKAIRTTAYRLKKRLVKAIYGIEIREV